MKKIIAAVVAIAVVVFVGYMHRDQLVARTSCADKIAHQFTTTKIVPGAWNCIAPDTKEGLSILIGIDTPQKFAGYLGLDGSTYTYLGVTNDGGYTYRFDYAFNSHNEFKAAWQDIQDNWTDPKKTVSLVWAELNGETQGWGSFVKTFYLYPPGETLINIKTGEAFDIGGDLETIK